MPSKSARNSALRNRLAPTLLSLRSLTASAWRITLCRCNPFARHRCNSNGSHRAEMHHPPTGVPAPWFPEYTPHRRSVWPAIEETLALCGTNTVGITRNNSKHATQSCLMPCTIDWAPLIKSLVSFESSFPSRSKRISTGTVIPFSAAGRTLIALCQR